MAEHHETGAGLKLRIAQAMKSAHEKLVSLTPRSRAAFEAATHVLPGGNTRSVLHHEPYPLFLAGGRGAVVEDLDGREYVDLVGEFSAGLFGHDDPEVGNAVKQALARGVTLGGPTLLEQELATLMVARFASVELLRFCNSGTEANLLALAVATAISGRRKVVVAEGGYHGGVLTFGGGESPLNVPHEFLWIPYNDAQRARDRLATDGDGIACVLIEPMMGAGGNIPAEREFLMALREGCDHHGALLIFDEVKTARFGPGGLQGECGITPDMTTFGKFIGGGMPLGAFGGRADVMARLDPRSSRPLSHAGTFNNNVVSLSAGLAALGKVFTPQKARDFHDQSEARRLALAARLGQSDHPATVTGLGSIFSLHFIEGPIGRASDITESAKLLGKLFHAHCLLEGVRVTPRSDCFVSLPSEEAHLRKLGQAAESFMTTYSDLLSPTA